MPDNSKKYSETEVVAAMVSNLQSLMERTIAALDQVDLEATDARQHISEICKLVVKETSRRILSVPSSPAEAAG